MANTNDTSLTYWLIASRLRPKLFEPGGDICRELKNSYKDAEEELLVLVAVL